LRETKLRQLHHIKKTHLTAIIKDKGKKRINNSNIIKNNKKKSNKDQKHQIKNKNQRIIILIIR